MREVWGLVIGILFWVGGDAGLVIVFPAQCDLTEVIESLGRVVSCIFTCVLGLLGFGANFGRILLGRATALVVALERGFV